MYKLWKYANLLLFLLFPIKSSIIFLADKDGIGGNMDMIYNDNIHVGEYNTGHIQGIAIDKNREYMYCSFTTCFIKIDTNGNVVGSVKGLAGHLGCIAYNEDDGRVYGSLEFKHDKIGQDILDNLETKKEVSDGFYIVIFDVEKIDRMDMDAEKDGIMTAVYLKEVLDDYKAPGHRHGCSGIDGTTFAPLPGSPDSKKYLYVAYGIYTDLARTDNDHRVILRYDISNWKIYEHSLNQADMHTNGPASCDEKYFVYTGNTHYGIQNLEYDPVTNYMFAAVYRGRKPHFPNYPMYVIDMNSQGSCEKGSELYLAKVGNCDEETGIYGYDFPYGATGIISLGDGTFYFSQNYKNENGYGSNFKLYTYDVRKGFVEK